MEEARLDGGWQLGRYLLFDEIGAGGMATVHLGRLIGSAGFARTVAIKRLLPMFAKDPEFVSMFTDEARLASRMRHPNIAASLDVVTAENELFLVMEYIHGESLSRLLRTCAREKRFVPAPIGVAIVAAALTGLHAAHEATSERGEPLGVIHRDVSPQNIMVGTDGVARVLDFGVAKAAGRIQLTRNNEVKGKTAYMPPEQLRGRKIDRRADIYAASVVLWEVLALQRLFAGDTEGDTVGQVLEAEVPPPSRYAPGIPPELDALVLRGLSRDPNQRFSTAIEMASALERTVLLPTPREVGAWVESVGAETLVPRSELVRRIEELDTSAHRPSRKFRVRSEAPTIVDLEPPEMTGFAPKRADDPMPTATDVDVAPVRSRGRAALLALGAVACVGVVAFAGWRLSHTEARQPNEPGPTTAMSFAASPAPPPTASSEPAPKPAEPVAKPSETSEKRAPRAAPPLRSSRPAPARGSRPAPNCDPPYIIDSDGIHIPKPECG